MPHDLLLFLLIPLATGFVGWITNWAAVKMIFHPHHFVGMGPVGWQSIVTRHAHKFATGIAQMALENLLTTAELVERIDPKEVEKRLAARFDEVAETLCQAVVDKVRKGAWDSLPPHVKTMVVAQWKVRSHAFTGEIVDTLRAQAHQFIDLHGLIYDALSGANADTLVRLTKRIGHREFKFIEYYGGVFGLLIGLVQVGVWTIMQTWWLMPIVGILVGLITNWLAIQMIFRPLEPTRYIGLVTYQGLFPKRQGEIARDYGIVAAQEILSPKNLMERLSSGDTGRQIASAITEAVRKRIQSEWQSVKAMVPVEVTEEMLEEITEMLLQRLREEAPQVRPLLEDYLEDALQIASTVEQRLGHLPKPSFERVLRGIFEEDEGTLIAVGGVLGGCVGLLQGLLVLTW